MHDALPCAHTRLPRERGRARAVFGCAVAADVRRRYSGERWRSARIWKSEISCSCGPFEERWRLPDPPPFANPNDGGGISCERRGKETMECAVGRVDAH